MFRDLEGIAKQGMKDNLTTGKLKRLTKASVGMVDIVITIPIDQLKEQLATEYEIKGYEKGMSIAIRNASITTYGKQKEFIMNKHNDETNPHFHITTIPRARRTHQLLDSKGEKVFLPNGRPSIIKEGRIGSLGVVDKNYISKDFISNINLEIEKLKKYYPILERIDHSKIEIDNLKEIRQKNGIKGGKDIGDLSKFKQAREQNKQAPVLQANQIKEQVGLIGVKELNTEKVKLKVEYEKSLRALDLKSQELEQDQDQGLELEKEKEKEKEGK